MGADRKLVDWAEVVRYYRRVDAASPYVQVSEIGRTTEDRPFLLVAISTPATLARLDYYADIQQRLADPRRTTPEVAESLIEQGKSVVLITCSVHSTEVASTMTAMEFLHDLVTEDTPRHRAILQETIFLLVPSLNPDGVDKVTQWYRRWLGTPYEGAPMVELYHKYVGHDNNRDWYMFTQAETRLTVEKIQNVWRPQIVYDIHQMGTTGARIFVPPWADPVDPNVDPLIVQQMNAYGAGMASDLTAAGRKGVVINGIYDFFTPARHYQSYHHGLRLLSESASVNYATPVNVPFESLQVNGRGFNAKQSSWNFLEPWPGGEWKLRDIVDQQLITFETVLHQAAAGRRTLLRNFYRIGQRVMERQSPSAFVVPRDQFDPNAMTRLLETLDFGSVEIRRSRRDFVAGGRNFREGDYVISMQQPFANFAKTLLEKQDYPDLREYPGGPPRQPYDVTAHSLPLLLGVDAYQIDGPFRADVGPIERIRPVPGRVASTATLRLSPALSNTWIAVNRLLAAGVAVFRNENSGDFYLSAEEAGNLPGELANALGVRFEGAGEPPNVHRRLRAPRIGLYSGFTPIMDEGWTRWMLEQYEFHPQRLDNARIRRGGLRADYDVIILPDASSKVLQAGYIQGVSYRGARVPPEYTGGIEDDGAVALRAFAEAGGVVLAFNSASSYAIEKLDLPVENLLGDVSSKRFYAPGSLLNVEVNVSHPLCFGMRPREAVWFEEGPAFRPAFNRGAGPGPQSVLRYAQGDVLASGWLLGEDLLVNRSAVTDVQVGRGHVVLFGIRPQYRAQSNATFKLVFNGLFYWR
ncbi:MAG: peptidase M14 [Acidobacteria bacterium]|nr:peptidase M14 [Acidobacteriota bacterium]